MSDIVERMQKDAELQALRAEVERLKSFEELYKAGCEAWSPVFETILNERDALRAEVEWLNVKSARIQDIADTHERNIMRYFAENERLKAEAKANLDLAERHMNEKHKLRAALEWFVRVYDRENPFRSADFHNNTCDCIRCVRDEALAALEEKP